jgi:hypothetical protein
MSKQKPWPRNRPIPAFASDAERIAFWDMFVRDYYFPETADWNTVTSPEAEARHQAEAATAKTRSTRRRSAAYR